MVFLPAQTVRKRSDGAGSQGGCCRSLMCAGVVEGTSSGEPDSVAACRLGERVSAGTLPRAAEWCRPINGKWVNPSGSYCLAEVAHARRFVIP